MPGPSRFTLPAGKRVGPRWIAASLAAHGALILGLVGAYRGFVMTSGGGREIVAVDLRVPRPRRLPPPPLAQSASPPRASAPMLSLPQVSSAIPTRIPPATPPAGDSNGVRGGIGMSPSRGDPRLWVQPMYIPEGGGRPINMDSVVRQRMLVMASMMDSAVRNDSLAPNRPLTPPRWTFEHDGKTYGIDQQGIHFGTFSIPTAVLAFLPFPQGNIDQARANARMMDMRADILRAAARAEAEDDFRRAVAQIRERKDRERREQRERDARQRRDNDQPIP